VEELTTLNGIGEAKAIKIIEYRNTNGLFKSIEDIKNVSGIGETFYEKIKDSITI
jgi:competence protein ComEA